MPASIRTGRVALLLLVLAAACGPQPEPPNLLLIVVDTLRADHLGCYGDPDVRTPVLDALAARGAQYRCQSQAPWTLPSVSTILSGLYPAGHGANFPRRAAPPAVSFVAEKFLEHGYSTAGFVSHDLVGTKYGFERGFQAFDDSNARGHLHISSGEITGLATDWLETATSPFFLFLHYFDPHYSYLEHPGWTAPLDYDGKLTPGMQMTTLRRRLPSLREPDIQYLRNLYRGEIGLLDGSLRVLFRHLERSGQARDLAIVVAADHGEEFVEHGWLGHTRNLREVVLDVPLLVSAPGRVERGLRAERAMQVDVRPTLLDLASLPGEKTPGASLRESAPRDRSLYSEVTYDASEFKKGGYAARASMGLGKQADQRTLRSGPWKLVHDRLERVWHLYDLDRDPGELRDVSSEHADVLARLRAELETTTAAEIGEIGEEVQISEEDVEKLRGLGYVN